MGETELYNSIQSLAWKNKMQSCKRACYLWNYFSVFFPEIVTQDCHSSPIVDTFLRNDKYFCTVKKSPNCNKRTVFWHKIITTLLRQQELLYSFINSLLSASPLGWVWYVSGLELSWVQERGQMLTYLSFCLAGVLCWFLGFFSLQRKVMWAEQCSFIHIQPNRTVLNSRRPSQKITKNKQKWQHKAQRPWVSTSKTVGLKKVIMQLGWFQMKASFS